MHILVKCFWSCAALPTCLYLVVGENQLSTSAELRFAARIRAIVSSGRIPLRTSLRSLSVAADFFRGAPRHV